MVSSRPSLRLPGVGLRRAGGGAGLGQAGAQGGGGRAGQVGVHPPAAWRPRLLRSRAKAGRPGPGAVAFTAGLSVLALVSVVLRTCETFFFFSKILVAGMEAASLLSSVSGFASNLLYCVLRVSRWLYFKTALFSLFSFVPK